MEPTPSLLRAAAVSAPKASPQGSQAQPKRLAPKGPASSGPVETESAMMRAVKSKRGLLIAMFVLFAVGAATGTYLIVRRAPPVPERPRVAEATPPPDLVAPPPEPAKRAVRRKRAPHREEAMMVDKKGAKPSAKIEPSGALPRKKVETDSRPAVAGKDGPPPPKVTGPLPEDLPPGADGERPAGRHEAVPLTDEEQKQVAEASIDADGVRFVVRQHMPQVRACYERAFKDSAPAGRVEVAFAIGGDGKAKQVRTDENTIGSELLGKCLEQKIKEWTFPRPVGGDYELIYPFVFQ